ncbi:Ankyrin repeat and SAM domain-containing [Argiope bruennichi]|uniref:Ankyrin repeat and SAM domain-containing n=1 Tax=Argiope bruennichi TaxID=94029 RepID=A0A8T0FRD3_ARGBR|nr:Ankyrin repeat and SAM domain-containing [Argiope bruennichi]
MIKELSMQSHHDILYFCQKENIQEVKNLLEQGVCVNFQNSEGETPLQVAAANGFSQIVSLLISYGALVDFPNSYGWTPLIHAARHGHYETVSLLLKKKAKVNICNKLGLSPVVAAAWSGDLKTVKLLIEAGAMVDHIASLNQNTECDLSPLMAASFCGYEDIVIYLLDEGANVDQVSPVTGLSPLMLAAYGGRKKIAQIIVESGSDTTKTDICNQSAMDFAITCFHQEIILFLESVMVSKYANEGSETADIFLAVKSDSSDANNIEILASKFLSTNLSSRKLSINSASDTLDRKKASGSERFFSKKSETQTGLKNWFGGVAQHFQQKMLTRLSPRHSDKFSTSDVLGLDATLVNDVFEETKSSNEALETVKQHPLSPNKYLANELKEHKIEAIKPPLPSLDYFNPITVSSRRRDKSVKLGRNCLLTPILLKDYKKKDLLACSDIELQKKEDGPFQKLESIDIKTNEIHVVKDQTSIISNIPPSTKKSNEIESYTGELTALLQTESLQKYAEKFRDHEVDIDTLQYLTKEDLTDIGIESSGSQKILLKVINKLQKSQSDN